MMQPQEAPRDIHGIAKTVREILSGRKYQIDYYQREYRWADKQVRELVEDLADKFLNDYEEGHPLYQLLAERVWSPDRIAAA